MRIKDALADKGSSYTRASVATSMVVPASRSGYAAVKRVLDWLLSLMALILLFPLFLAVAVAIKLDSRGPVFFVQTRIGKNGKPFSMYKFRSMCVDAEKQLHKFAAMNERDGPVFKIANDPRVTRVGRFIRRTCIDELPQLLNILKGDMGIVGPRPALPNEVAAYTPHQMLRLQATPGLTCYWQITPPSPNGWRWIYNIYKISHLWWILKLYLPHFVLFLQGKALVSAFYAPESSIPTAGRL